MEIVGYEAPKLRYVEKLFFLDGYRLFDEIMLIHFNTWEILENGYINLCQRE